MEEDWLVDETCALEEDWLEDWKEEEEVEEEEDCFIVEEDFIEEVLIVCAWLKPKD
jgi:hypothetical protein